MSKFLIVLSFLLTYFIQDSYCNSISDSKTKYALIIAISNYDQKSTGWQPLNAENDVELIQNALTKQGFKDHNIKVLTNNAADKNGITSSLKQLEQRVSKGDIVFVHYSGHGQQIFDDNDDELDGYDESLIPWGAPSSYEMIPNYTGEKHLRDDEFGQLIKNIRLKVGNEGHVVVILDSCHSGTGTRGGKSSIRGGKKPLAPPNYATKALSNESGFGIINEKSNLSRGSNSNLGKFILFTGANFDEVNHETISESGRPVGSLSYALSKALSEVSTNDTYRSIFANVQKIMADVAPFQNPTMEGDADYKLFSGEIVTQKPYTKILKINRTDQSWVIDEGEITGISAGSKFVIYPAGTTNPKNVKALGVATVITANYFTSTVKSNYKVENAKEVWLFIHKKSYSHHILKVNLSGISNSNIRSALSAKLGDLSTIELVKENEDIILSDYRAAFLKIITKDTEFDCRLNNQSVNECVSAIKQYSIGHFLSNIKHSDLDYNIEIELIPVSGASLSSGVVKVGKKLSLSQFGTGIIPVFPEGTQLLLKVKNTGNKKIYFNILDLQPDGIINPVIPNNDAGISPEECMLLAGDEQIIPGFYIELYPPYGVETYKMFASKYPINLTSLLTGGVQNASRSGLSDLELLFVDALDGTRGSKSFSSDSKGGTIKNYVFKIVEK